MLIRCLHYYSISMIFILFEVTGNTSFVSFERIIALCAVLQKCAGPICMEPGVYLALRIHVTVISFNSCLLC